MRALLNDALRAGAMGLSTNQFVYDKFEHPLPSQLADDAEYRALFSVVARFEGAIVKLIVDHSIRMTRREATKRIAKTLRKLACACSGCPHQSRPQPFCGSFRTPRGF